MHKNLLEFIALDKSVTGVFMHFFLKLQDIFEANPYLTRFSQYLKHELNVQLKRSPW